MRVASARTVRSISWCKPMKVKELIELNQMITDVVITIRENGCLRLDEMHIGPAVGVKPPYPTRVPRKPEYAGGYNLHNDQMYREAAYNSKSINAWDDGHDYWQVKVNRIPKAWLDLEVFSWEVWEASTVRTTSPRRNNYSENFKNVNFHGQRINITALPSGETLPAPEEAKPQKDDQLDGQMNIDDWMKGAI